MIVSDDHRFVYVHIPKCGGSTVREWLRQRNFFIDPRFDGYADIPGLGNRHSAHLPLHVIHDHYPDVFEKMRSYKTMAIARDPLVRFKSSFAQYQREFFHQKIESMSPAKVEDEIQKICDRIAAGDVDRDPKLMHFQRQSDFVFLNGEKIVERLYPIRMLDTLIEDLAREFSIAPPARPSLNVRRRHRIPVLARGLNRAKRGARAILPRSVWRPLHDLGLKMLTRESGHDDLGLSEKVTDFLNNYYANDIVLYRDAQERFEVSHSQQ